MKMRNRKIIKTRCKMHWYFESGFWTWLGKWIKASDDRARARRNEVV
jgi:hypothetical protein